MKKYFMAVTLFDTPTCNKNAWKKKIQKKKNL